MKFLRLVAKYTGKEMIRAMSKELIAMIRKELSILSSNVKIIVYHTRYTIPLNRQQMITLKKLANVQ